MYAIRSYYDHQQVGLAGQGAVCGGAGPDLGVERRVGMHLAIAFQVRARGAQQVVGLTHLERGGRARAAKVRMRQQRDLGHDAEAFELVGRHGGDLGHFLRGRILVRNNFV